MANTEAWHPAGENYTEIVKTITFIWCMFFVANRSQRVYQKSLFKFTTRNLEKEKKIWDNINEPAI